MTGLKSDELGFLVGKPISLTDLHDGLSDIHGELGEIKGILSKNATVGLEAKSIDQLINGIQTADPGEVSSSSHPLDEVIGRYVPEKNTAQQQIASSKARDSNGRFISSDDLAKAIATVGTSKKLDSVGSSASQSVPNVSSMGAAERSTAPVVPNVSISTSTNTKDRAAPPASQDKQVRDSKGRFVPKGTQNDVISESKKSKSPAVPNVAVRDDKGRFLPKHSEATKAEKDSIGSKIKNAGSSIVGAIGDLGSGNDQADPSVQAMGEIKGVLSPVGRGLGKLFTGGNGGVSRGQDRWYRRFFKQNAEKVRADDLANKREQKLLSNIEKKEAPEANGSNYGFLAALFLAFMGTLAGLLLKGFQLLASPLKFLGSFFGPMIKVLQALARSIGLVKLANRLGGPNTKGKNSNTTVGGGTAKKPGEADKSKGGGLAKGGKAILKKLPIIGALMTAGFLGKELYDINGNDESKDTKTKQIGGAVGGAVGGVGGALGGAAAGAAAGSVIPGIGTVAGAIVGALIGGIGGEKVGGLLGDKFGDWVNELRAAGVTDKMAYSWNVGVNAMSIMWRDFTSLAGSVWNGMVAGLQSGWTAVTDFSKTVWQGISDSFTTTTQFMQSSWAVATTLVGGALDTVWTSLGELASQVNDAIKAKTGIDIGKHVNDLKATVSGWADSLKTAFSDFSENVKGKLGEMWDNSYFGGVVHEAQGMVDTGNQPLSTTKEQDANQTAVLNSFLKAGFSKSQAVALTAEVGRENDYNSRNLYGYHKDESNGAINMGMISWQGDRAKRLSAFMEKKGLIKNGKMVQGQASLDAQAEFIKWEIENDKNYATTKQVFANSPNADPEAYAKTLGTNYVRWAYGQNKLKNGKSFDWKTHDNKRRKYKDKANAKTSTAIPFRPGYNAQTAQAAVDKANGKKTDAPAATPAATTATATAATAPETTAAVTPGAAPVEPEKDPNSLENMMQTINNYDGMSNIKMAVASMLKNSSEGKPVVHQKAARGAVVPAVQVSSPSPIAEAPKVALPLANNANKDSNAKLDDVSRDVSDRRIAHIVTGAYSSPT